MGPLKRTITFGTSYYPDHWPEDEQERDLNLIKACGLDVVRFGEFSWGWFAPHPGIYDFAEYDRFVDLAYRCGLRPLGVHF